MQEPQPNPEPPPEESLRRLYEQPLSARQRHLGLMFRGERPQAKEESQ